MSDELDSVRLRALLTRQIALSDEIELHCEQLDDDDKRLTRLEWLAVIATGWLGVLTVLLAWVVIR